MSDIAQRPVHRSDYVRIKCLLYASKTHRCAPEDMQLWQLLKEIHEDEGSRIGYNHFNAAANVDEFVAREEANALIVLEALARGELAVPAHFSPAKSVCSTIGCSGLADLDFCFSCRMSRAGQHDPGGDGDA